MDKDEIITSIKEEAIKNKVPILQDISLDFIKLILRIKKPKKILEIGTAVGYSAINFVNELEEDVYVKTIERNDKRYEEAIKNINSIGYSKFIDVVHADATEYLPNLNEDNSYDVVFIDAAKGHYKMFFDMLIDKLNHGGIVISDNILYKGMIASDDYVVRRKKTIVKRMRTYLDYICDLEGISTSLVPIGDGLAISYKD